MKFFIRNNNGKWDEVSEYVFNNRKYAVVEKEPGEFAPRYQTDEYFTVDGNKVSFNTDVHIDELDKICRFLNVSYSPIVDTPESILIHKANSKAMHVIATGQNWTMQPKKKAA